MDQYRWCDIEDGLIVTLDNGIEQGIVGHSQKTDKVYTEDNKLMFSGMELDVLMFEGWGIVEIKKEGNTAR